MTIRLASKICDNYVAILSTSFIRGELSAAGKDNNFSMYLKTFPNTKSKETAVWYARLCN